METVAVYAPAEGSPLHAEIADEAVALPDGVSPVAGYLDIGAVIEAALETGADAIHPGYGFLSENPAFARACEEAGVVFVGPSAETIGLVGNKREARRRLAEYGVPVLPGTEVALDGDAELAAQAGSVGYPLMVKASEGGGGIGMNLVRGAGPSRTGGQTREVVVAAGVRERGRVFRTVRAGRASRRGADRGRRGRRQSRISGSGSALCSVVTRR